MSYGTTPRRETSASGRSGGKRPKRRSGLRRPRGRQLAKRTQQALREQRAFAGQCCGRRRLRGRNRSAADCGPPNPRRIDMRCHRPAAERRDLPRAVRRVAALRQGAAAGCLCCARTKRSCRNHRVQARTRPGLRCGRLHAAFACDACSGRSLRSTRNEPCASCGPSPPKAAARRSRTGSQPFGNRFSGKSLRSARMMRTRNAGLKRAGGFGPPR